MVRLILSVIVLLVLVTGISAKNQIAPEPDDLVFNRLILTLNDLSSTQKLDYFYRLIEGYQAASSNDKSKYYTLCQDAIRHGQTKQEDIWLAAGFSGLSHLFFQKRNTDSLSYYLDLALLYTPRDKYAAAYLNLASLQLITYTRQNQNDLAAAYSEEITQWIKEKHTDDISPYHLSKFLYNSSLFYFNRNDLLHALPNVLLGEEYGRKSSDRILLGRILGLKAAILETFEEQEFQNSIREAANIYLEQGTAMDSLRGFSQLIQAENDLNKAVYYFHKGQMLANKPKQKERLEVRWRYTYLLHYMALLYEKKNQKQQALELYKEILSLYPDEYIPERFVILARLKLGQALLEKKATAPAIQMAKRVIQESRKFKDKEIELAAKVLLSHALSRQNQFQEANTVLLSALQIGDTLRRQSISDKLLKNFLNYKLTSEKEILTLQNEQALQNLNSNLRFQRLLFSSSCIVLLLISILTYIFYQNLRIKAANEKQLKRQNQKLDRFAQSVSHDILSNLDLILSTGKVLVGRQGKPEGLQAFYEATMRSVKQTKQYCQNILLAARQPGNQTTTPVDTNQVLQTVLAKLSGLIQQYNLGIEHDELPLIPMQTGDLAQIFQNLLHNAISFAGPGGQGNIAIRAITENDHIKIGVLDNGPGIPADQLEAVFEPGISIRESGTGIGLATVKAIVESYGGQIWMEDSDMGGAALWFIIPKN